MMNQQNELERLQLAAFNAFNSQDYAKAIKYYKKILEIAPADLTTHYNIATTSQQLGKLKEAKKYYLHYLAVKEDVKVFNNLAVIALNENDTELAKEYFLKAITTDSHYPSAYLNLAQLYAQERNLTAANTLLLSYPDISTNSEIRSELSKNYNDIGMEYSNQKNFSLAIDYFLQAVEFAQDEHLAIIYRNLTGCMIETGRMEESQKYAIEAYERDPEDPINAYHLSICYLRSFQYSQAREFLEKALKIEPLNLLFLQGLSTLNLEEEKYEDALDVIKTAFEIDPKSIYVLNLYGRILHLQGRYSEALELYLDALALDNHKSSTLSNVGSAYLALHQLDEAEAYFIKSLEINPKEKDALLNRGQISYKRGQYREAISWITKTLEFYPDYLLAHQNLAVMYLGLFEFDKGWEEYRHRQIDKVNPKIAFECGAIDLPINLEGKRILLRHEQGLGDELFFLRFISILKARGAWIAYFPNPKLFNLLASCPYIDLLLQENETIKSIDYNLFIAELPRLLKISSPEMIPSAIPLYIEQEAIESVHHDFKHLESPLIGITWRAGKQEFNYLSKDISLSQVIALFQQIENSTIVVLQRNPTDREIKELKEVFGDRVVDASHYNDDLKKMVSILSMLDTYIAVSNTNVHLAASIGKKCHLLIPFPPEWRWGYESKPVSPWFPDFKIYRQSSYMGSWDEGLQMLIDDVKKDLVQKKELEQFRIIINESIQKVEELIEHQMFEDAERLCEKLLSLDKSNHKVLGLLSKILLSTQQYEQLEKVIDMLIVSAE